MFPLSGESLLLDETMFSIDAHDRLGETWPLQDFVELPGRNAQTHDWLAGHQTGNPRSVSENRHFADDSARAGDRHFPGMADDANAAGEYQKHASADLAFARKYLALREFELESPFDQILE